MENREIWKSNFKILSHCKGYAQNCGFNFNWLHKLLSNIRNTKVHSLHCDKNDTVVRKCFVGKVFLEISPVSFLMKLQALSVFLWVLFFWHSCFSVSFAKFLRTPFFTEPFGGCFTLKTISLLIALFSSL